MQKLVVLVRNDLPSTGYKAAQAAHAVAEFMWKHQYVWANEILVIVEATQQQIERAKIQSKWKDFPTAIFKEPDMNNEETAFAVAVGSEKTPNFLSNLPLLA